MQPEAQEFFTPYCWFVKLVWWWLVLLESEDDLAEWSGWLRVNNNPTARIYGIVGEDSDETLDVNPRWRSHSAWHHSGMATTQLTDPTGYVMVKIYVFIFWNEYSVYAIWQ